MLSHFLLKFVIVGALFGANL